MLRSRYVSIRNDQRQQSMLEGASNAAEAIVRIAQSQAKLSLSIEATPAHVAEAIRLFKVSTGHAANFGSLAISRPLSYVLKSVIENIIN